MTRRLQTSLVSALGLLLLILDAKTALQGASEGITLCLQTIIPSLLPFLLLSILLTSSLAGINFPILRPIGRLCGIPRGAESVLLVGILGGYPTGAHSAAQAYKDGSLSRRDAQRMLAFCNLAGPSFLFGIVAGKFTDSRIGWVLWAIQLLSALFVGMVLPGKSKESAELHSRQQIAFPDALQRSLKMIASVCGWIIIFRIILAFLNRWILWLVPAPVQVAIAGILELSNGCCELSRIPGDGLRFIICSAILAFGGLCVTMQTASAADGLSLSWYLPGKLLQCIFSILLSLFAQYFLFQSTDCIPISVTALIGVCAAAAGIVKFLYKSQKNSSIPGPVGV